MSSTNRASIWSIGMTESFRFQSTASDGGGGHQRNPQGKRLARSMTVAALMGHIN